MTRPRITVSVLVCNKVLATLYSDIPKAKNYSADSRVPAACTLDPGDGGQQHTADNGRGLTHHHHAPNSSHRRVPSSQ
jgi:hypothetical protein